MTDQAEGCSSAGGVGGRLRRSAMNWSNSDLSLAKRRRSRNAPKSFCYSSMRRSVSALYSSKARLPELAAGRSPGAQAHDFQLAQGPVSCPFR